MTRRLRHKVKNNTQNVEQIDGKNKKSKKVLNSLFILLFALILLIPNLKFNLEKNAVSKIDNRMLSEFPKRDVDFFQNFSNFYSDRLGYRNEIINSYTKMNDNVFGELVHPTYMYGQDGYVFFKVGRAEKDYDFMRSFAAYVRKVQDYCEDRNVPFIYMLNPSKITVYKDKLPKGFVLDNSRIDLLIQELDRLGVNYLYTADPLTERRKTEEVFNVKYDAGHWNEYGAQYAVSLLFDKIREYYPNVQFAERDDYEITQKLETSLPVSNFAIKEYVPLLTHKHKTYDDDKKYADEIQIDKQNNHYRHNTNNALKGKAPKLLFFHGSYFLEDREKFVVNSFSESMAVHNYINLTNFDYYFSIENPDIVIFETAEYATTNTRFPMNLMATANLIPALSHYDHLKSVQASSKVIEYTPKMDKQLQNINVKLDTKEKPKVAYLKMNNRIYDMKILDNDGSFSTQVTIPTENLTTDAEIIIIPVSEKSKLTQNMKVLVKR
jgi:hypothetical protein